MISRSGQSHLHPYAASNHSLRHLAAEDGAGVVRYWQGEGIEQVLEGHRAGGKASWCRVMLHHHVIC